MEFSANQIAEFLKGKVVGDKNVKVSNVTGIENGKVGTLSFLANQKYTQHIYSTKASIVLVNNSFTPEKELSTTLIYVDDAYQAFASLLGLVEEAMFEPKIGTEQPCFIGEDTTQGKDIYIGAFAYIGKNVSLGNNVKIYPQAYIGDNVTIGDNCIVYAGAKIYPNCKLGNFVTIHSGVVIGADGFGFAPTNTSDYKKIPQIGNVILEDYVEIGANTTVDRATMGSTTIRKGVKLDNLIQVGHNVEIGESTVIAAQTGIAGSTKIGKNNMIGGQVGISGHIQTANNIKLAAKAGVGSSIKEEGKIMMGAPAYDINEFKKSYMNIRRLPQFNERIRNIEKEIENLKNNK